MDLGNLAGEAKDFVNEHGGTDALKQSGEQLKDIATGDGSLTEKATDAAKVLGEFGGEQQ